MKNLTKQQFTEDLARLISFKTLTSDLTENAKALNFIKSKVSKKATVKTIKNGTAKILIASNKDTKQPDICYLVHVDVVPGRPDQFKMMTKNETAYGRGVSDMKFSIPIGYTLLNNLIDLKSKLSFALVVTTDEETGGFQGAASLAGKYGFKPKVLIVPDGGDNFIFVNKAKGVCALKIDSIGKPAHSSRIWDGKNALEPLIKLCNAVLLKYEKNNKQESMKTTVNIGKMQGGTAANQVCAEASCILDFRFPKTTSFKNIFNEVYSLAKKIDSSLKMSTYSIGAPTAVDINNPAVKLFIKKLENSIGRKIEIKPTYGASDARHFAGTKAPVLMIKPNGGDIHGENENIDIDSCLKFYEGTLDFLKEFSWHK